MAEAKKKPGRDKCADCGKKFGPYTFSSKNKYPCSKCAELRREERREEKKLSSDKLRLQFELSKVKEAEETKRQKNAKEADKRMQQIESEIEMRKLEIELTQCEKEAVITKSQVDERVQALRFEHDEEMMEKEIKKKNVMLEIERERSQRTKMVAQLMQSQSAPEKRFLMSMLRASTSRAEGEYVCTETEEEGEKEPDFYFR